MGNSKPIFLTVKLEGKLPFIPLTFTSKNWIDHKLQILQVKTAGSKCEAEMALFKTKTKEKETPKI